MFVGPTFVVFMFGAFCPWVNEKGALGGIIIGWAFSCWCSLGRIMYGPAPRFVESLPTSIERCDANFTTSISMNASEIFFTSTLMPVSDVPYRPKLADTLYSVSPFLYGFIGCVICTVSMLIISGKTGFNKPSDMDPKLFVPLVDNKKIFPRKIVRFFRFGVPEIGASELKHAPIKYASVGRL